MRLGDVMVKACGHVCLPGIGSVQYDVCGACGKPCGCELCDERAEVVMAPMVAKAKKARAR